MRIGLHSGAWTNFGSFTLAGAGAVITATSHQVALQALGWIGMAFGSAILIWGITIDGKQWWRHWLPGTSVAPVDLSTWRAVEDFQLYQAACLWVEQAPPVSAHNLPIEAVPISQRLKTDLAKLWDKRRVDQLSGSMSPNAATALYLWFEANKPKISNDMTVARADLIECAKMHHEAPKFLFGDDA